MCIAMITSNLPVRQVRVCPKCGEHSLKVSESRDHVEGKYRRYTCKHCKYRETTYEIPGSSYDELVELRRIVRDVKNLISPNAPKELKESTKHVICYTCTHFDVKGCGFGYPEAGSAEAHGCFNFDEKQ